MQDIIHDSFAGKYTTIAPSAFVLGRVKIFEYCYMDSNSTILPEKVIYKEAIVGAGTVVTKYVEENSKMIGIPAREMQKDKNYG